MSLTYKLTHKPRNASFNRVVYQEQHPNVHYGNIELVWIPKEKVWISPTREKFSDKAKALEHCKRLNAFYEANLKLKNWRLTNVSNS